MEFHPQPRPTITKGPIVRRVDAEKEFQEIKHLCPFTKKLIGTEVIEREGETDKLIGRYYQPGSDTPIWTKNYQRVLVKMNSGRVCHVVRKMTEV